ncbi:YciI family protein [Rathayibacter caricis]|nr:YciI family protein [Rathayibacter caricis]
MKVMLLMRSDGSYAGGDAAEDYAAWADYEASLKADGVFVESAQFADAAGGTSVGTDLAKADQEGGASSPSQMEGHSTLVGYYVLDCPDRDDALPYARRAPLYGSVEVYELAQH